MPYFSCLRSCLIVSSIVLLTVPVGAQEIPPHNADQNGDFQISLSELLRVIQFYNSGGLHCAEPETVTEDGYVPGPDPSKQACLAHHSDYDSDDWIISLSELLRLIQFFNSNGYVALCGSEDDFSPGPGESDPCSFVGDFTDPQDVTGFVNLPAEREEALDTLVVATATADWPVDAVGEYMATVISDAPSLVVVLDGADDPLLTGFVVPDGNGGNATLDATSTALALLYFALGGFLLPQEDRAGLLAELAGVLELAALVDTVEASLANGEHPLMVETGPVIDVLILARETLIARLQAEGEGALEGEGAGSSRRGPKGDTTLTNILIQPSGAVLQSGLQVLQAEEGGVLVQNNFRRRSYYYAYQTSYQTSDGSTVELDPPVRIGEPQKVTTTAALGEFTAYLSGFQDSAPWAPFQVGPFALPKFNAPSVTRTDYELILVGANLNPSSLPSDYADPRYAGELDDWQNDYEYVQAQTFFFDFFLSIVMLAATGASSGYNIKKASEAVEELKGKFDPEFARIGLALPLDTPAEYRAAAKEALILMRDNDLLRESTLVTLRSLWATSTSNRAQLERLTTTLRNGARMSAIVVAVETTITALDLGTVIRDLLNSDSVDVWDATVIDRVVRINPSEPEVEEGETTITLKASVNGLPDESFCYRWTLLPGSSGEIFTALEDGPEFVTKEDEITYFVSPANFIEGFLAQVSVEVFPEVSDSFDCNLAESIGTRTVTVNGVIPAQDPCNDDTDTDLTQYTRPTSDFISIDAPLYVRPGGIMSVLVTVNWSEVDAYTVDPKNLDVSLFVSGATSAALAANQSSILLDGEPIVENSTPFIYSGSPGLINSSNPRLGVRSGVRITGSWIKFRHPDNGGANSRTITIPLDESIYNTGCVLAPYNGDIYAVMASVGTIPNNSGAPAYDRAELGALSHFFFDLD